MSFVGTFLSVLKDTGKKCMKAIFEDAQLKFELNALHSPISIVKHLAGAF